MKSKVIERMLKKIPLEIKIQVACEMAFINLLSELGYREGAWTDEEDEKMIKLYFLADKLTNEIMESIKEKK